MRRFDQLKAMAKMVKWVKKKANRARENLRRNYAKTQRRRRLDKIAKKSKRRNRHV